MVASEDVDGNVSLLEWSHELDRKLLHLPFYAFRATSGSRPSLLYKLTSSEQRQECGFLLLDPDTCTAYYEGISTRTLSRRTDHVHSDASTSSELKRIVKAVHTALQEPSSSSEPMKRNIGWEQSRFSGSLSIITSHRDDPDSHRFKTSFDLDPLDHTAQADLLSSHFVRPLLALANAVAAASSISTLSTSTIDHATPSARSLKLVQRQSLQLLGLPVPHEPSLQAAPPSGNVDPSKGSHTTQGVAKTDVNRGVSDINQDDDSEPEDSIFFGPPGFPRPLQSTSQQINVGPDSNRATSEQEDVGDTTVVAPPTERNHNVKSGSSGRVPLSVLVDDDSDTEEEDTELQSSLNKSLTSTVSANPSPPKDSPISQEAELDPRTKSPPPAVTPSEPTTSQNSPSKSAAQRSEQKRRREEIKRMKEAAAAGDYSRKRSRF